jgi:4-amino-4-deoxy-L-arabinose transferase-like glycosyltransferase
MNDARWAGLRHLSLLRPPPIKVARQQTAVVAAAVVLAAITMAVNVQSARANSATFDESIYLFLGRQQLLQADARALADLGVAPLPVRATWTTGVLDPVSVDHNTASLFRLRISRARQNAILLFAVPLVLAILWWVSAGYGPLAGVTAATVVALSPNVIAHASLATTDVAFAAAFIVSIAALMAYLRQRTWFRALALAAALGTAIAAKYSGLGLVATALVVFVVDWRTNRVRNAAARDALVLAGAAVVSWAWHGWATAPMLAPDGVAVSLVRTALGWTGFGEAIANRLADVSAPIMIRGVAAQAYLDRAGQKGFLLGQVSQVGWWYFYPLALAMKATMVELAALAAFAVLAWRRAPRDAERTVVLTAAVIFFGVSLLSHRALGIRYVLAPFVLAVVAGTAWAFGAVRDTRVRYALAAVVIAAQSWTFLSIAPQHLAYFNGLAGGPANGYRRLVDSNLDWGQDLYRLAAWSKAHPERRIGLGYFGLAPLAAYDVQATSWRSLVEATGNGRADTVVISATYLQGVFLCGDPFAALRDIEPVARIGYTLLAYDAARDDVRRAIAAAARDPCAP